MNSDDLLGYARRLFTMASAGITFANNDFDRERYQELMRLSEEFTSKAGELPLLDVQQNFAMQLGYPTPKVEVRAAVFRDGEVLLVKELADGYWSMPGGWADIGEGPAQMVIREVHEETGFEVKVDKLVAVYNHNTQRPPLEFFHCYKLLFLCSIIGGFARPSYETPEVGFFRLDVLPPLSKGRTHPSMLAEALAHYTDASRPTWFE